MGSDTRTYVTRDGKRVLVIAGGVEASVSPAAKTEAEAKETFCRVAMNEQATFSPKCIAGKCGHWLWETLPGELPDRLGRCGLIHL